ncbi:MAG: arginine--tRNA ligase [Chloroflexota bacterium]
MVKDEIAKLLAQAINLAQQKGDLPPFEPPTITVERPKEEVHGDYACSAALKLAKAAKMPPLAIARAVVANLAPADFVGKAEVAPPGFINITLSQKWLAQQVESIIAQGDSFGHLDLGKGKKAQVEFVSANPTGPLHLGNARGAALGDALAHVLAAAGYQVSREYYVNDRGTQVQTLGRSVFVRYRQLLGQDIPLPLDCYPGQYVIDIAREIAEKEGDRYLKMEQAQAEEALVDLAVAWVVRDIRRTVEKLGVNYDVWFSEKSLYADHYVEDTIAMLKAKGFTAEKDGALWFVATTLGEDKDNVLVRSNEEPTYYTSDIAYHRNKFLDRGFDLVIDVWGSTHHGHIPRMKAAMQALGLDPERLQIVLYQFVRFVHGEKILSMGKRKGQFITLENIIDAVGADATRFFLITRSADSHLDFDLELAKKQSNENPVYYVQYAHARISSILRYAGDLDYRDGDVGLLTSPPEQALIRQMLLLPETVETAATHFEPHHLPHYAMELASAFHSFYKECRVVSSDPSDLPLTKARLKLVQAARIVLANSLRMMGISAPEQM